MTTQNEITDNFDAELREILISSAGLVASSFDGTEHHSLADLGLDSLATMELQAIVKARHGVQIPDEALTMSVLEISAFMRSEIEEAN
ncbi:acyl carrier protein [Amycolatopsis nigrescens]|uniref:acyl carrier protein n=1 Tax=Amycolatopsis nigrescens TaxID=381445 RepID=UPI0003708410|nr:acyl carrier protein [Amycolatopsis nigrescens]